MLFDPDSFFDNLIWFYSAFGTLALLAYIQAAVWGKGHDKWIAVEFFVGLILAVTLLLILGLFIAGVMFGVKYFLF